MSAARFTSILAFITSLVVSLQPLRAQDAANPVVENSKYQAEGMINGNQVFVRSGPTDGDYAVMKLDKGAKVTVVGRRFDWLKIVPPDGSFCYIAKAWVDRHGDGTKGTVTQNLNVRVGSQLNQLKNKLASKLETGAPVEIMGEEEEYYKIKPPADVYFYVKQRDVDLVKVLPTNGAGGAQPPNIAENLPKQNEQPQPENPPPGGGGSFESEQPRDNSKIAENNNENPIAPATGPATQPANVQQAEADFDKLEGDWADNLKKPLDQQDIPSMQSAYEKLAKADSGLPETLRRIAEAKANYLRSRVKDRDEYLAVKKRQDEMKQKQMALQAEREELEQRLRDSGVKSYAAVGVLRPSSLQTGGSMLYRLTDPANGRTVVYIRSDDKKIGGMIGQFIGVKGDVANDSQLSLRMVTPTDCEAVDPAKLFNGVAAQIVPPSLMPGGGQTATTGSE